MCVQGFPSGRQRRLSEEFPGRQLQDGAEAKLHDWVTKAPPPSVSHTHTVRVFGIHCEPEPPRPRLIPAYPGEASAPIRTAKAERRHQERLRMQSPELAVAPDKDLSPAEKRALEAEKRAMWRAARYAHSFLHTLSFYMYASCSSLLRSLHTGSQSARLMICF